MSNQDNKVTCIGNMTKEQLDAEIWKGIDSLKSGKFYTEEEVDAIINDKLSKVKV